MNSHSPMSTVARLSGFLLAAVTAAVSVFLALYRNAGTPLLADGIRALEVSVVLILLGHFVVVLAARTSGLQLGGDAATFFVLITTGTCMALVTAVQMAAYACLPADSLSFSESHFVTNILQFRTGTPLYTPPGDNNASVYTPGAPILTYLVAAVFGQGDSLTAYRVVQLSYVILASIVATGVCDLLARLLLTPAEYRHRPLWLAAWWPLLFLVCFEPRFNTYNHSLHNDGLSVLVSMCAFWLIAKFALTRASWLIGLMAVLPAVGFLVKQNQLMWLGVFFIYLVAVGGVSARQIVLYAIGGSLFFAAAAGICYWLWGYDFYWWTFASLGSKKVAVLRIAQHLLQGGLYVVMALFAGWVFVLRGGTRAGAALWGSAVLVFGIQLYTSGIAWQSNHMGPGVVLAVMWFFVALLKVWPNQETSGRWWPIRAQEAVIALSVLLLLGSVGLFREPRDPVPPDFSRYVADIEQEFVGQAAEKVLTDYGTWVYLKDKVIMKDRGMSVAVHIGKNQPQINHAMLAATIERFQAKYYDKVLARQLDTEESTYDYQNRGSGVKSAILANYREIRRIPAVQGVTHWWPKHLVNEIVVLVPRRDAIIADDKR